VFFQKLNQAIERLLMSSKIRRKGRRWISLMVIWLQINNEYFNQKKQLILFRNLIKAIFAL